jgi:hypothetical protein
MKYLLNFPFSVRLLLYIVAFLRLTPLVSITVSTSPVYCDHNPGLGTQPEQHRRI